MYDADNISLPPNPEVPSSFKEENWYGPFGIFFKHFFTCCSAVCATTHARNRSGDFSTAFAHGTNLTPSLQDGRVPVTFPCDMLYFVPMLVGC